MWRPGQLITIRGIVYRIMHRTPNAPFYPDICDGCAFAAFSGCVFPIDMYYCWDFIPNDCCFVKVWPKNGKLVNV